MKPQQQQQQQEGGMSRAAKKRAKKKNKNKSSQQPTTAADPEIEEKDLVAPKKRQLEEADSKKSEKKAGGILKKSKYSVTPDNSKDTSMEDDAEGEGEGGEVELNDIALSEDIQELLKSDEVNLRDILLLDDNNSKKKASTKSSKHKDDDDKEDEMEDEEEENPFQELTSKERARCALNFLLAPSDLTAEDFYEEYWEKKALCVQAPKHRKRFNGFLSLKSIRQLTEKHTLHYGRDLNVTRYHTVQSGQPKRRANIDPPPFEDSKTGETRYVEADSSFVWEQYDEKKATIRLLCPHKHNDNIHSLLSLFELEWGCMVGANAYLTPPGGSQGFGKSMSGFRVCDCSAMSKLYLTSTTSAHL